MKLECRIQEFLSFLTISNQLVCPLSVLGDLVSIPFAMYLEMHISIEERRP